MMFPDVIPNSASCISDEAQDSGTLNSMLQNSHSQQPAALKIKKKRNLPGNPDPDAQVIALSPKTLLATNRFVCEICNRGFQRDQNLQLHRRGHNLPWKLKQRSSKDSSKRAYVCPEPTCLHHHPSRALGDLTGIKKHYCRKHGEKKWNCHKCSKIYAVHSDWKAHSKTCGTREYRCDCGTLFSRKDSFITHRAFCDALAEESARLSAVTNSLLPPNPNATLPFHFTPSPPPPLLPFHRRWTPPQNPNEENQVHVIKHETLHSIPNNISSSSPLYQDGALMAPPFGDLHVSTALPPLSATALLQRAATIGAATGHVGSTMCHLDMHAWQKSSDGLTRDFLGLTGDQGGGGGGDGVVPFTGGVKFPAYDRDRNSVFKHHGFGFNEACSGWSNC